MRKQSGVKKMSGDASGPTSKWLQCSKTVKTTRLPPTSTNDAWKFQLNSSTSKGRLLLSKDSASARRKFWIILKPWTTLKPPWRKRLRACLRITQEIFPGTWWGSIKPLRSSTKRITSSISVYSFLRSVLTLPSALTTRTTKRHATRRSL